MTTPREIAEAVRECPRCGTDHYSVEVEPSPSLPIKAVRCAKCGKNILGVYRRRMLWTRFQRLFG